MARRSAKGPRPMKFRDKLILNQWMMNLLGVDPLREHDLGGKKARPWHVLAAPIKDPRMEGLDASNIHRFFQTLVLFPWLTRILRPLIRMKPNLLSRAWFLAIYGYVNARSENRSIWSLMRLSWHNLRYMSK